MNINKFLAPIYLLLVIVIIGSMATTAEAQNLKLLEGFTIEKEVSATSVKNQAQSGTCWSFASLSFMESEAIRMGKGEYDFSEMFVARHTYMRKAESYVRMQGHMFFTAGGQCHDVLNTMRQVGLVPESVYSGRVLKEPTHDHTELDVIAKSIVDAVKDKQGEELSPRWKEAFSSVLDVYLGESPEEFTYKGKSYTPQSFAQSTGLNVDDYVQITSYSNHEFYKPYCLESRYNWSFGLYENVPLSDFMEIIDNAIENGYSLVFNGDVSEETFSFRDGLAQVPAEIKANEKTRQELWDNHATTVDHVMHITGIAKGPDGKKYYLTKNSWGENQCGGYMYLSEAFIKLKAVSILIHKDGIPTEIRKKIGKE